MVDRADRRKRAKRRAMGPLTRKLLRDMKDGWKSFVAIWVICTLAIMLYNGIDATWRCTERNLNEQFEATNMADIWVSGALSSRTVRDIEAIDGVEAAQLRVSVRAEAPRLEGKPTIELTMNDGDAAINRPLIFEGGFEAGARDQCILQQSFAEAHGLAIGDMLRLEYGDRVLDIEIAGFGVMPERVVTIDSGELTPSPLRFGYAFVSPETLAFEPMDELILTLKDGAAVGTVRPKVEDLLDERQVVVREREDIIGLKMAMDEAQQIRSLGAIFPMVFFIIAALITWTTMSRLIENQRMQIGSLFAMGYGRGQLTRHYACYGVFLAALGCAAGFAGAVYFFSPLIIRFLSAIYVLPGAVPRLELSVMWVMGTVIMVITGGASVLSARSALRQVPATLLRPKPPGKGKRVFLENIRFIWSRMRFSDKMIARNMLRSPVRLVMGLIGAMGCAALILTGFGMRDSVAYVFEGHYDNAMKYDARVLLSGDAQQDYGSTVAARANATMYEQEMITGCEAMVHGEWKSKAVYVLEDDQDMIQLHVKGERIALPGEGASLTRKAAEDFGLTVGDAIQLRIPGERAVRTRVMNVIDMQMDQGIYFSKSAWRKLDMAPWMPTDVLLRGGDIDIDAAERMDGVLRARTVLEERMNKSETLMIMDLVVLLLVLFSGILAFVVFYNLGQLNFSERIRELATLKVLGFTPREMKKLVLRENLLITFIGIPVGLAFGPKLHEIVLTHGLPNAIDFVPVIAPVSWAYTVVLTVSFAVFVNWILGAKFRSISMVEALKSVE